MHSFIQIEAALGTQLLKMKKKILNTLADLGQNDLGLAFRSE